MKRQMVIMGMTCVVALTSVGGQLFLKFGSGSTDWTADSNYYADAEFTTPAGRSPGGNDTIVLRPGLSYPLSAGDGANWRLVNGVSALELQDGAVIDIEVADSTADLSVHVCATDGKGNVVPYLGSIRKTGEGALKLTNIENLYTHDFPTETTFGTPYCVGFDIVAGHLCLPELPEATAIQDVFFGPAKVSAGATLHIVCQNATSAIARSFFHSIEAEAGSTIVADTTRSGGNAFGVLPFDFAASPAPSVRSYIRGLISGNAMLWTSGELDIESTANANGPSPIIRSGGVLSAPSLSIGTSSLGGGTDLSIGSGANRGFGGTFRYTGMGETVTRNINFYGQLKTALGNNAAPSVFDAGETGGLAFTGYFGALCNWMGEWCLQRIVLTGDNTNECFVSGPWNEQVKDGVVYPAYLNKKGTGIWHFQNNNSRYHSGVTQVSDGTLRFDSIANKGTMCSLGLSTNLRPDNSLSVWAGLTVPYAFALGAEEQDCDPVFEYSGTADASVSDRPLVLVGSGGTLCSTTAMLSFSGVSARDENARPTLKLEGQGTVSEVSDGANGAQVSIAKNGTGTWTLAGNQTFSGDVKVNSGRLELKNPHKAVLQPYKWFRLSFADVATHSIYIRQIGLYDKDGVRQNAGLTFVNRVATSGDQIVATPIGEGEAGYDAEMTGRRLGYDPGYTDFSCCFTEQGFEGNAYRCHPRQLTAGYTAVVPTPSDASTWWRLVMHLPNTATPITHFDVQTNGDSTQRDKLPARLMLEGSFDGRTWTVVYDNVSKGNAFDLAKITAAGSWLSDGTVANNESHARPWGTGLSTSATGGFLYYQYQWFRINVAQIGAGGKDDLRLRQICLYDAQGVRQNGGLTYAGTPVTIGTTATVEAQTVKPGMCGYAQSAIGCTYLLYSDLSDGNLEQMFNGGFTGASGRYCVKWGRSPDPNDETTWLPIVMHLADSVNAVTHFDIEAFANDRMYLPTKVRMDASTDGKTWETVYSNVEGDAFAWDVKGGYNCWLSDATDSGAAHQQLPYKADYPLNHSSTGYWDHDEPALDQLQSFAGVEVSAGATFAARELFTLGKVIVDANENSAGTLENIDLQSGGTIVARNVPRDGANLSLPMLRDCRGDYTGWTVELPGLNAEKYVWRIKDGILSVERIRKGLCVIVR